MTTLVDAAEAWLAEDPDPQTRAELRAVLDAGDAAELEDRFGSRLEFGTAGLRGRLGAGPNRMNRVVVRRAAAGLARWLLDRAGDQPVAGGVVVGRDARHNSDVFARDTAAVIAGAGIPVHLFADPVPTPLLAFAVRHLGCAAGVMVTASHNPPADNGYKVYLVDGAQLIPPHDREISERIDAVGPLAALPMAAERSPFVHAVGPDVREAYVTGALRASVAPAARDVRIVYTPLHGVGRSLAVDLLRRAGFPEPSVIAAQAEPDPDFPTVAFPNPEEPRALELAIAEARRVGADVVLANDPDADRLGVAVPDGADGPDGPDGDGAWRRLRGDEIGVLLADHLIAHTSGADRLVVTTVVSSRMLSAMAAAAGIHYEETLTGFKWIVRPGLAHPEWQFLLGYEEALGYTAGGLVHDKDGLTAALLFAELVASLKARGQTVTERLDALACQYGLYATDQWSVAFPGTSGRAAMQEAVACLRQHPPTTLDGHAVTGVEDLQRSGGGLPPADVVILHVDLDDDGDARGRVVVRPSGTEPKLKLYFEVSRPVRGDVAAARARTAADITALRTSMQALVAPQRRGGGNSRAAGSKSA